MAQVRQTDKRTGVVYVYEAEAVWDPERKQTRYGKRKLIGHIDRETGELVPNRPKRASATAASSRRAFYGTWALLSAAARESGLEDALVDALGKRADDVLAIAGYLVSEAPMPLSRLPRWAVLHDIPVGEPLDARRCSELLASIGESERDVLCASLMRTGGGEDLLLLEIASIGSYERALAWSRRGGNGHPVPSPQVNLAVLVNRASGMPLCYRQLRGPIADVATTDELLASMGANRGSACLALGQGFWSTSAIDALMGAQRRFLAELPPSIDLCEDVIARYGGQLETGKVGDVVDGIRGERIACVWSHGKGLVRSDDAAGEGRPGTGEEHPCYAYLLFDPACRAAETSSGFGTLLSSEALELSDVIAFYRGKRAAGKRFDDMEGLLDLHASHRSTEQMPVERMMPGRLFVAFVAHALAAWLQRRMRETGLDGEYTLQGLLDEVEMIERFTQEGRAARVGKVTPRQRAIFERLGYSLPVE